MAHKHRWAWVTTSVGLTPRGAVITETVWLCARCKGYRTETKPIRKPAATAITDEARFENEAGRRQRRAERANGAGAAGGGGPETGERDDGFAGAGSRERGARLRAPWDRDADVLENLENRGGSSDAVHREGKRVYVLPRGPRPDRRRWPLR